MNSKTLRKTAPLWLLPLFAMPQIAYSQATVYAEEGGFVFFEAESALPDASAWALQEELPNFSGDGYIEWTGPDFFASSGAGQGILIYTFEITNPGNYELRWRTHIAKGESNTESNDSWVRFPSGVNIAGEQGLYGWSKVFMGHFGAWFWDAKVVDHVGANVRQYFPAGTHTMQVSGRSFGHAIDKMALFKYEELDLSSNDLDIRTGTPQASIDGNQAILENPEGSESTDDAVVEDNALQIASGINHSPGECVNESLALTAQADIHLVDTQSFNEPVLLVAPEPARTLLRFDLSNVPQAVSAELQVSVITGEGAATLSTHLANGADWTEAGAASASSVQPVPEDVLLLHESASYWLADSRYALPLQLADLPLAPVTLSLAAAGLEQPFELASRENSLHMPLLVINGGSGFCEAYQAANMPDEIQETGQPTVSGEPVETDNNDSSAETSGSVDTEPDSEESGDPGGETTTGNAGSTDNDSTVDSPSADQTPLQNEQANQGTASGGGVLFWLSLPMILLFSFARLIRKHD